MSAPTILIVEDEVIIARDLELLLQDMGYQVPAIATTADEALQAAACQPDLVLLDIHLAAGSSGLEVAERLRERCDTPVIFLTAHADPDTVARAQAISPYGYLLKPFNEREIAIAVQLALAKSASDRRLRASERLFATTLRSIGEGVIVTDTDRRIIFLNARAERLTGWCQAEALGRPLPEVFAVRPAHPGPDDPPGEPAAELQARSGERYDLDTEDVPLTDERSQVYGSVVVFRDITQQRRNAAAQRRLERAMLETQRQESLGVLAGGIAHDFNNILMSVQGSVQIAEEQTTLGSEAHDACIRALRGLRRAADLTLQMLAYAGRGRTLVRPIVLNAAVREIAELLSGSLARRAALELRLDPELPPVLADVTQMHQVVLNLLTNAAEALGPGGGTIAVETRRERLTPDATGAGTGAEWRVWLSVCDNGSGMDQATQAKMFDPFFTTKVTGRGLGLAAVQGIVRAHGGSTQVRSAPGAGTTIQIGLPATDPALRPAAPPARPAAVAKLPKGGTLLVIDDEPGVRAIVVRLLERLGFVVHSAPSSAAGLELLAAGDTGFDAVLTDLTMPGLSGSALVQAIQHTCPGVPVVVMSGYSAEEVLLQHHDLGASGFLQKPFTRDELVAVLAGLGDPAVQSTR